MFRKICKPVAYWKSTLTQSLRFHHRASANSSTAPYTLAIARQVGGSLDKALTHFTSIKDPIDPVLANKQHEHYLETLRHFVPTLCLPALENHADGHFVEDTVVAIGGKAVLTKPGHPSRQGEVETIADVLSQLGYDLVDMRDHPDALCDGGDVMYTTRHLFVGLSSRTNQSAIDFLSEAFGVPATGVPMGDSALHLKSIVSHLDPHTILAPTGPVGDQMLSDMNVSELGYDAVRLPSMLACNVVSVNGGVLAQDGGCAESRSLLSKAAEYRNLKLEWADASEFAKIDGALTCCSVLLQI
eukprot:Nitzschia sp. Nitz4//scaffold156_size52432//11111//12010//NITZ4_006822-RA/size52432-processed-gene-0.16-mRNA-1//1//CDS//3329537400//7911//frame0